MQSTAKQITAQAEPEEPHTVTLPNGARVTFNLVAPPAPVDVLVRKDLSGIQPAAWKSLKARGLLATARIGQHEYCKASALVGLVDTLGAEQRAKKPPKLKAVEPSDALAELADATRKRGTSTSIVRGAR